MSAFHDALSHPQAQRLLAAPAVLQAMLRIEAALADAQADLGLIASDHAAVVQACCAEADWPFELMVERGRRAGSLAIPLAAELTRRVRQRRPEAAGAVHFGATSQDLIDTAMSLQGQAVVALILDDLDRLLLALEALERAHGRAPTLGRTLMQAATVIPFGVRVRNWAQPLRRCREHLQAAARRAFRLQLAGPVGTGAAWGSQAPALAQALAQRLGLLSAAAGPSWQAQRDETARLAAELGVLVGAVAKVATDVAALSQPEVGELQEAVAEGRGGSSAMPHKRNPVGCLTALAAARRVPPRVATVLACMAVEQERGLGTWQAEVAELADILTLSAAAVAAMADGLTGATVNRARMRHNIEAQGGLPMAEGLSRLWTPLLGRDGAHDRVQALCLRAAAQGLHLRELALAEGLGDAAMIQALFRIEDAPDPNPDSSPRGPAP